MYHERFNNIYKYDETLKKNISKQRKCGWYLIIQTDYINEDHKIGITKNIKKNETKDVEIQWAHYIII